MLQSLLFCRCNNLKRRGVHLLVGYPLEISYFAALKANSPRNSTGITHGQKVNASSEPNLQFLTHCPLGAVVVILEGWFFQTDLCYSYLEHMQRNLSYLKTRQPY